MYKSYRNSSEMHPMSPNTPIRYPVGKRTVGMCAHTASIIYYLNYYKNLPEVFQL